MRTTIAFAIDLLPLVENGSKTITIREGHREYAKILAVTDPNGEVQPCKIKVGTQFQCPAHAIPEQFIQLDGFLDLDDMIDGMKYYYPDFSLDSNCTVVLFELI